MVNLRNRIKRVITFSGVREQKQAVICSAIKQLRPIEFYYLHGFRTVEPFALGVVLTESQDNLSLLCWQTAGFSDLNETKGWKLYRMSDMEDIEILPERFTSARPGYDPQALEMVKVICCVSVLSQPGTPEPEPAVFTPPPRLPEIKAPEFRPIVRVISHNQLMERFRNAHPQRIPQMEDLVWQEPLNAPFPETEKPQMETPEPENEEKPKVRPEGLLSNYGMHTTD